MHLLRQQDIPSDFARCVGDEDNRGGIIFAQQLGKVIKGSQILSQGCSSSQTSIYIDATFHLPDYKGGGGGSLELTPETGPWPT